MSVALGSTLTAFSLLGTDGVVHSSSDFADAPVLAIVQACNHCPYVLAWEGRIADLQRAYADRGVAIVLVNSNNAVTHPADSYDRMVEFVADRTSPYTYLHDPDQTLARALASSVTPEVFVYDRERRLVYHGAVDDSRDETAVSRRYFRDAIEAVLHDEAPELPETAPIGCSVKWRDS
jgi:hypothetical protein